MQCDGKVYTAPDKLSDQLLSTLRPEWLWDQRIVPFKAEEITAIQLSDGAALRKGAEGSWSVGDRPAESNRVQKILSALSESTAERLIDVRGTAPGSKATAVLAIRSASFDGEVSVSVAEGSTDGRVMVWSPHQPGVVEVVSNDLLALAEPAIYFADRRLLPADLSAVTSASFRSRSGHSVVLAQHGADRWTVNGIPAHLPFVRQLLRDLASLEADHFLASEPRLEGRQPLFEGTLLLGDPHGRDAGEKVTVRFFEIPEELGQDSSSRQNDLLALSTHRPEAGIVRWEHFRRVVPRVENLQE